MRFDTSGDESLEGGRRCREPGGVGLHQSDGSCLGRTTTTTVRREVLTGSDGRGDDGGRWGTPWECDV